MQHLDSIFFHLNRLSFNVDALKSAHSLIAFLNMELFKTHSLNAVSIIRINEEGKMIFYLKLISAFGFMIFLVTYIHVWMTAGEDINPFWWSKHSLVCFVIWIVQCQFQVFSYFFNSNNYVETTGNAYYGPLNTFSFLLFTLLF